MPNLCCNLISVSQLIDAHKCIVSFTNTLCTIQDCLSGNLIGNGESKGGLYFFSGRGKIHATVSLGVDDFELWHQRLRHPADRVVKYLPPVKNNNYSKHLNKAFRICPQAKQSHLSFSNSQSRASRIFELIHCDLWGPYVTPSS